MSNATALRLFALLVAICFFPAIALTHPGDHDDADGHDVTSQYKPVVTIQVRGDYRYITSNGIPNHKTGKFPNQGNPNAISPQHQSFRVTIHPKPAGNQNQNNARRPGPPALFGVAINGIVFDPGTAEIWRHGKLVRGGPPQQGDWRYEGIGPKGGTLGIDDNNAHVQPQGTYHYHGIPNGLVKKLDDPKNPHHKMILLGWAADGYPIYAPWAYKNANDAKSEVVELKSSYVLKQGSRPDGAPAGKYDGTFTDDWTFDKNAGDLDEHNGRVGVTPEFPDGSYYYVLTQTFPFVPRSHYGTPDPSFSKGPPDGRAGGQRGQGGQGRPGRPERRR